MAMTQRSTVVGVFPDRPHAEQAITELHGLGFRDEQIGYVVPDEKETGGKVSEKKPGEGAALGAASGGVAGGLLGAGAALLIPGIGPAIAGGILAATLGGLAAGALVGGLTGALVKLGVPEEEARYYQSEFQAGRPIVTVEALGQQQAVVDVFHRCGAHDASSRPGM
ncbi:hypothetical protein KSF_049140 [Reticulibacter mediterranei]|uniref:General stress protein 17M-like domain-containing protein n=1 Tax=Reticulibacter mediterranei TaxID=2778369 RepID=A0A8J3IT73_9CHLR|nr:hypothetical protein [Reticulibacter mediterranei]GHO94866.1 hypothetical protein KSF_049140 [Reticulibacter mediterranei]